MKRVMIVAGFGVAVGLWAWSARTAPPAAAASDYTVTWEAEGAQKLEEPFKKRSGAKSDKRPRPQKNSGSGYLEIPDKANGKSKEGDGSNLPGYARFEVNVPQAGSYKLWARVLWPNGCGNSFWAYKDGRPKQKLGEDGTYDVWHWVELKGSKLALSKGTNVIIIGNREDGVLLDQLQVTTSGRVPTNQEKPTAGALR